MATVAAAAGGVGRIVMALHGGERSATALAIEACLGSFLGLMVAGLAIWIWPDLKGGGWQLMTGFGIAGAAGAIGTRMLDIVIDATKKKLGVT